MELARACVAMSAHAYSQQASIESDLAHVLIVQSAECRSQNGDGDEFRLIIAFRGTASLHDFVTDAEIRMAEARELAMGESDTPNAPIAGGNERVAGANGVEVHRGFLGAYSSVHDEIVGKLRALHPVEEGSARIFETRIVVTGHSLGGALAMLCAKALAELCLNVEAVITFGQPRVGNKAFSQRYDRTRMSHLSPTLSPRGGEGEESDGADISDGSIGETLKARTWRFVNEEDPVPRLPGLLAGYRHAGNEAFLSSLGGVVLNPGLLTKLISDGWGFYREWKQGGPLECLGDHRVAEYCQRLGVAMDDEIPTTNNQQPKVL